MLPKTRMAPPSSAASLLEHARTAIAAGDRRQALAVLRAVVAGAAADVVPPGTAEALVTTARGSTDEEDRRALERHRAGELARADIIHVLHTAPLSVNDMAAIRVAVEDRTRAVQREEAALTPRGFGGVNGESPARLGAGYLELKMIRGNGPYLYFRIREGRRLRSRYVGKATS